MINPEFIEKIGKIIRLSKPLNNGELNLDAICGTGVMTEYIDSVICVLETIVQNRDILHNFSVSVIREFSVKYSRGQASRDIK